MQTVHGFFGSVDYVSSACWEPSLRYLHQVRWVTVCMSYSNLGLQLHRCLTISSRAFTQKQWFATSFSLLLWATISSHLRFPGIMFNMCVFFFAIWLNHSLSALSWCRLSRPFSQPELFSYLCSSHISATKAAYSLTWTLPALFLLELSQS